jgi:acetylornithine deacetylase
MESLGALTRLAAELTARLVAIDSVNPSLVPGGAGEGAIAGEIARFLRERDFRVSLQEAAPGRPNVIGVLEGAGGPGAPLLMLNGHTDTVGVAGMSVAPFGAVERAGRLYGRGAIDMKGGVGAILAAGATLAARPVRPRGTLLLAFSADEEYASVGSEALAAGLRDGGIPGVPPLPERVGAILCEPTGEGITIAHKGFAWLRLTTQGRAAHGSDYREGVDAIALMGRVLGALSRLGAERLPRVEHPLLGRPSVHASTIVGGRELSTYPDRCTLEVERRTLPGERREGVAAEMSELLSEAGAGVPGFAATSELFFWRDAYEVAPDAAIVATLVEALRRADPTRPAGWQPDFGGAFGWMDSAIFGAAGIPTVIYGPAGEGAHGAEEYVEVASLGRVAATLVAAAELFLQ